MFALGPSLSITHGFALAELAVFPYLGRGLLLGLPPDVGADAAGFFEAVSADDPDRIRLWKGEQIDIRDPRDSMALFLRLTAYPASLADARLFRAVARRVNALTPGLPRRGTTRS